jgi:hypothetical protein
VTLTANTSLVSGTGNITFGSTINGTTADTESLGLNAGASGVITFGGAVGGSVRLSDLVINNAGSLALGANTTINIPNAFTLNKPLAGAGYSLGVTNNAVISADLSGLSTISIGGTTSLGGSVTTTGTQTYTGAVVLAATSTLTTTNADISFGSTVNSNGSTPYGLILANGSGTSTFVSTIGATNALASLTTATGTTVLSGDVSTTGAQSYGGNVVLNSSLNLSSLTNGDITIAGNLSAAQAILQLLGGGAYILNGTTYTPSGSYTNTSLGNVGSLTWSGSTYSWTPLSGASTSELLLVGGGGAAGSQYGGGGGGGGGLIYKTDVTLSAGVAYTIGIGTGGIAVASNNGGNGESTSISGTGLSLTAIGGGGGSTYNKRALNTGGSGGGTRTDPAQCSNAAPCPGATSVYYSDGLTYTYGNPGGTGGQNTGGVGGGGGGAFTAGGNASTKTGGNGGNGLTVDITGQSQTFAGGGGGGAENVSSGSAQGIGGTGGGGTAVISPLTAQNGQANTGGGGGALGGCISGPTGCNIYQKAGDGGSGIAVMRYSVVGLNVSTGSGKFILAGNSSTLASLNISSTSTTNAINGIVGGSTAVTVGGSGGVFTLSAANTYTGGTTISAGTLQAG